jgi:phospholipase/carboxylesterase
MIKNQILPYPEIANLAKECNKLVVFLHGLGSDGNDLIGLTPFISKELPNYYFISPHGVEEFDLAPYGRQWFSLKDNNPSKLQELLASNIGSIEKIISAKQQQLNLTNKDTIIIGFSQGTMTGLYLNFIQKEPFAGVIGFSGRLITPPKCLNKITPICLIHGELDDVVDVKLMDEIIKYLQQHEIKYSSHRIANLAHSIDASGLQFALQFIKENIR